MVKIFTKAQRTNTTRLKYYRIITLNQNVYNKLSNNKTQKIIRNKNQKQKQINIKAASKNVFKKNINAKNNDQKNKQFNNNVFYEK